MFTQGSGVFVQIPDTSNTRILHPGEIMHVADGQFSVSLPDDELPLAPGDEFILYFEKSREFMKVGGRVLAMGDLEEVQTFTFETVGEAVSAESRQCYRVSLVMTHVNATCGDDSSCRLMDVSQTGFSVVSSSQFQIGQVVPIEFVFEGQKFIGTAAMQGMKELPSGKSRYGFHVVEERGSTLADGLNKLSIAIQRLQLQRRSGAA